MAKEREQVINFLLASIDERDKEVESLKAQLQAAQNTIGSLNKRLEYLLPKDKQLLPKERQGLEQGQDATPDSQQNGEATPSA